MATVEELQAELAKVELAITSVYENGEAYSIQGQHSVKSASLRDLENQRRKIRNRILKRNGILGRTTPDFS